MSPSWLWCATCALIWLSATFQSEASKCRRRHLELPVSQTDLEGRKCWDTIRINSCGGLCDSVEVADWLFPYKISKHLVCVHETMRQMSAVLRNCEPGAMPGTEDYHYLDASTCACQICSSRNTSCEWLPPRAEFLRQFQNLKDTPSIEDDSDEDD